MSSKSEPLPEELYRTLNSEKSSLQGVIRGYEAKAGVTGGLVAATVSVYGIMFAVAISVGQLHVTTLSLVTSGLALLSFFATLGSLGATLWSRIQGMPSDRDEHAYRARIKENALTVGPTEAEQNEGYRLQCLIAKKHRSSNSSLVGVGLFFVFLLITYVLMLVG